MEKIKKILNNIVKQYDLSCIDPSQKPYGIIGAGNFAVVFDFGNAVMKLSNEGVYEEIKNNAQIINYLKEQGVNTPETYLIEKVDIDTLSENILDVLYKTVQDDEQDCKTIRKIVEGEIIFSKEKDTMFCIFQEKIDGINIFKQVGSLNEILELYNQIPQKHYEKFILDANNIIKQGIVIDNINMSNFLYNKEKGFYFIDLGNLGKFILQDINNVKTPYDCTIENVLDVFPNLYNVRNQEVAKNSLDLFAKMYDTLKSVYINNTNDEKFKEQTRREIISLQSYLNGYLSAIHYIPENLKSKYTKKFNNIEKQLEDFKYEGQFETEYYLMTLDK